MALSTTRTLLTQTGINTHQVLNVGGLDSAGIATFSNFKTGSSNLHSTGLTVGDTFLHSTGVNLGTGATVSNNGNATFSGIITASSFVGDISNATGAAAGLGTALSQTQTDPLNKVYYTNKVLSISTTTTIDHPATANLAYTQYGDIKIEDGHDLIIKTDDDFKYDILGISTTKLVNNEFPNGLSGDITGNVTGNVTGNINNSSNLLLKTDNVERLRITQSGTVGIGSVIPANILDVQGSAHSKIHIGTTGTGHATGIQINHAKGNSALQQWQLQTDATSTANLVVRNATSGDVIQTFATAGYITAPKQPSFSAYINGFTAESSNTGTQTMPFNATYTNVGGHFKTNIYKFVAPVAGNYFFSLSQNHNARVDTRILKNGAIFHAGESENTANVWDHHHLSCVMPLAVNDIVHVTTDNQDGSGRRAWNSSYWDNFSGFLIG